jgi:hypothetical protein
MIVAMSAMAASIGESSFGQWCGKFSDLIDRLIPIALTIALVIGSFSVIFSSVD